MARNLIVNIGDYSGLTVEGLTMTTRSSGVCRQLHEPIELRPPYLNAYRLRENQRVDVFDAQGLIWTGRLEERKTRIQAGTALWTFTALGYAASARDLFYTTSTTFACGTAIEDIFTSARASLCPDISSNNNLILATARALAGTSVDVIGKTAHDVWDAAAQIGDEPGNRLYWHVWPGSSVDVLPDLEVIARPSVPAYRISLSQGAVVDLAWALSRLYNRVVVKWGSPATYTTMNDTNSQAAPPLGYGVVRTLLVNQPLVNSATDAQSVGQALLNIYRVVRPIATSIVIPEATMIEAAAGNTVLPWRVRAGNIVRIRELRAGAIATSEHDFYIAATSWSEAARTLTLTPEGPENVANLMARY